jgi:Protein of unknown function (DUF4232)
MWGSAMTRYGHIGWRAVAVAAFAGTAALAVILTRVPAADHAALSSNLTQSPCAASGLEAWLGLGPAKAVPSTGTGNGGHFQEAGGTYYTLEFTNVSARACRLYGYPEVSAYAGSQFRGTQVGSAAVRDTSIRPQPVVLAPGATAHSVLVVTGTGRFRPTACAQVTALELRVMLPDQGLRAEPAFVPVRLSACSKKGPEFLSVQAIQPRPGIPGFTMP